MAKATDEHIQKRIIAVRSRSHDTLSSVVECLTDSHFRKQRNLGPSKEEIATKVKKALDNRETLNFVALMFTRKNICPLKRGAGDESVVDFAEILSLVQLNSFASFISKFYPYDVKYYILSEGKRFLNAFDLCLPKVLLYQKRMKMWIKKLKLKHIELIDYEDYLAKYLSEEKKSQRKKEYEKSLKIYRALMTPILNTQAMGKTLNEAIDIDPVKDSRNSRNNFVPLWDSIKNSLPYPEIKRLARNRGRDLENAYIEVFSDILNENIDPEIEKIRKSVIIKSWNAAIEHNARIMGDVRAGILVESLLSPNAFRTTINPKPNSACLGIYSIRETTSRVQPWHGTAYLERDGLGRIIVTTLTKLEIEARRGVPISINKLSKNPFLYGEEAVAQIFQKREDPIFNLNTRI